ncbi:unnamed protein product [Cylindrotheca closterium]|uniref:peptidylprolyl isomerase n=1 Tax=Cylindrotheca closterium TaxID=2856 RepID=A0AAD2CQA2_9STRA|nr:unnamed protein product [Cylindrotheca closterium]
MPGPQRQHRLLFGLFCFLAAVSVTNAAISLSTTVTDGPEECDNVDKIQKGNYVQMHYTGSIDESSETGTAGEVFDSSDKRGKTFDFTVGKGQVIKGWDHGLLGLCKGAKATLIVPPLLGYGSRGAGGGLIPGGATLRFDVEVVDVADDEGLPEDEHEPDLFGFLDEDGDGKLSPVELADYFQMQGSAMPDDLMEREDKDGDGFISWEEFSGPKGATPPGSVGDEL